VIENKTQDKNVAKIEDAKKLDDEEIDYENEVEVSYDKFGKVTEQNQVSESKKDEETQQRDNFGYEKVDPS